MAVEAGEGVNGNGATQPARPPFEPVQLDAGDSVLESSQGRPWRGVLECPAYFPVELFSLVLNELVLHPEHNSSLILRADILPSSPNPIPSTTETFTSFHPSRIVLRRLLPRRPNIDPPLEQECIFHARYGETASALLLMVPRLGQDGKMPFYHPEVDRLAFVFLEDDTPPQPNGTDDHSKTYGRIRIEAVLPASTPSSSSISPTSRLYRTCLSLLSTLHKHGHGKLTGYRKRVHHDVLIARDLYQDLYLVLKERHKHWVSEWKEGTDPRKHVFEVKKNALDVAIAAFLMLLWKEDFPALEEEDVGEGERTEWATWGRPAGGFVDVGCGNGLLVHILVSEGYTGFGLDLRPRKSWSLYPPTTQSALQTLALSPPLLTPSSPPPFPAHSFLIGNHADELTPWLAPLATLTPSCAGFLNLPCCAWELDRRFTRSRYSSTVEGGTEVERRMEGVESRVKSYLVWLEEGARGCGWEVGLEALRIPSTRNWALVGRRAEGGGEEEARERVWKMVEEVRERGLWKVRDKNARDGH